MYTELPCEKVYRLPTGHSPFFSQPKELVDILLDLLATKNIHDRLVCINAFGTAETREQGWVPGAGQGLTKRFCCRSLASNSFVLPWSAKKGVDHRG